MKEVTVRQKRKSRRRSGPRPKGYIVPGEALGIWQKDQCFSWTWEAGAMPLFEQDGVIQRHPK